MARTTSFGGGVRGAAELNRRLEQLSTETARKYIHSASRAGAEVMEQAAKDAAPVGPEPSSDKHSKLRPSINVLRGKSSLPDASVALIGTGNAFHALFLERGTIHMRPRPWMEAAIAGSKDAALDAIANSLEADLGKSGV